MQYINKKELVEYHLIMNWNVNLRCYSFFVFFFIVFRGGGHLNIAFPIQANTQKGLKRNRTVEHIIPLLKSLH